MSEGKKIGVVLSGGGLKATCSGIATFSVLEELGFKPYAVCASSGGAIAAAMYCSGLTIQEMKDIMSSLRVKDYFDLDRFGVLKGIMTGFRGWSGLLKGRAFRRTLTRILGVKTFEECKTKCYLVAVNVSRGRKVVLCEGNLVDAAFASSAIPFVYQAMEINKDLYIDGGAISNVPAFSLAEREHELDHIIISSTQDLNPMEDATREDIMSRHFTPYHIINNWVESLVREERYVHLDTFGIPNTRMEVKMESVGFFSPEDAKDGIESAEDYIRNFLDDRF